MKRTLRTLGLLVTALFAVGVHAQTPQAMPTSPVNAGTPTAAGESGLAAVYSDKLSGHVTASGKKYSPTQLTAAHKILPFGTNVRVTNIKNGKSVELRITDRGPKQANRILDITPPSRALARYPENGNGRGQTRSDRCDGGIAVGATRRPRERRLAQPQAFTDSEGLCPLPAP